MECNKWKNSKNSFAKGEEQRVKKDSVKTYLEKTRHFFIMIAMKKK